MIVDGLEINELICVGLDDFTIFLLFLQFKQKILYFFLYSHLSLQGGVVINVSFLELTATYEYTEVISMRELHRQVFDDFFCHKLLVEMDVVTVIISFFFLILIKLGHKL